MEILPTYAVLVARRLVAGNDHNDWVGVFFQVTDNCTSKRRSLEQGTVRPVYIPCGENPIPGVQCVVDGKATR